MLSKFHRTEQSRRSTRNSRAMVQYLMQQEVPRRSPSPLRVDTESVAQMTHKGRVGTETESVAYETHKGRVKWHNNPLYETKGDESTDASDWGSVLSRRSSGYGSGSRLSLASQTSKSDCGYKSDDSNCRLAPLGTRSNFDHRTTATTEDFGKAARDLLDAIDAFGDGADDDRSMADTLYACELELIKISIAVPPNNAPSEIT